MRRLHPDGFLHCTDDPINIMKKITIRKAAKRDGKALLGLIDALAEFEKLTPPSYPARRRLLNDAFGERKRFDAYLAFLDTTPVGYAIMFETYSSFLALPTLYLEDIFVLPRHRGKGIGLKLFQMYQQEAIRRGCGRMEWIVLDWNKDAIRFYDRLGAKHMKQWLFYRLEL